MRQMNKIQFKIGLVPIKSTIYSSLTYKLANGIRKIDMRTLEANMGAVHTTKTLVVLNSC